MKHIYNTFTIPCEKSKMVPFASTIIKNIIVLSFIFSPQFRFSVKLICCIAFGSVWSASGLLESNAIIYSNY